MSSIILNGDTSGSVTLQSPSVAGTTVVTLPNASGTIMAPATAGTSGQFLTSSAGGAPTWTTPSAGAMTLISTITGDNTSGTIAWTGLSGYGSFLVVFNSLISSGNIYVYMNVGYGSTPTYVTTGYKYQIMDLTGGTLNTGTYPTNATSWQTAYNAIGTSQPGLSGQALITNPTTSTLAATLTSSFVFQTAGGSNYNTAITNGYVTLTSPVTAVKLTTSSGNFVTGAVSLYGISS